MPSGQRRFAFLNLYIKHEDWQKVCHCEPASTQVWQSAFLWFTRGKLSGQSRTISPSFACGKIHLPFHQGGFIRKKHSSIELCFLIYSNEIIHFTCSSSLQRCRPFQGLLHSGCEASHRALHSLNPCFPMVQKTQMESCQSNQ